MGEPEISRFLAHLAVDRKVVAPSIQNQALSALLFLYQNVLEHKLDWLVDVVRAKRPHRLPAVLTQIEIISPLAEISGVNGLVAHMLSPDTRAFSEGRQGAAHHSGRPAKQDTSTAAV